MTGRTIDHTGRDEFTATIPPAPTQRLTYLAAPYSHPLDSVRGMRAAKISMAHAALVRRNILVYSPICHSHEAAERGGLRTDWAFWEPHCRLMLTICERVIVLQLDGWRESVGVAAEIRIAQEMGVDVWYLEPGRLDD